MTIEEFATAVQAQVAIAAGLNGAKVIWEDQNTPRPARPFITLMILDDGPSLPLSEDSVADNPDADPDIQSSLDLNDVLPSVFDAGSVITTVPAGDIEWNFVIAVTPFIGTVPAVSFDENTQTLRIDLGASNTLTGTQFIAWINANATSYITAVGTGASVISGGLVTNIGGGQFSQNPILIQSTDRPEITVRATAFTDAPKSGAISPAFSLLKSVRRAMGGEAATEALDPIAVLDRGNVQNVNVMLETGYEGRAVLDLKFGSIETESDAVNTIETVIVETTIKDVDDSVISDTTITLSND